MSEGDAFSIILPVPPILNHRLIPVRTGRTTRLVLNPKNRAWKAEATQLVRGQVSTPCQGAFRLEIFLPQDKTDIDAREKSLLDALQSGGAIRNDRDCIEKHTHIDASREGTALLIITPI